MAWNTENSPKPESLNFDDNFAPQRPEGTTPVLEDSKEYLRKLERRLERLKSNTSKNSMMQGLEEMRESQMGQLISSSYIITDFIEEKPNEASFIERKLFPDKTAISAEELQVLTQADVLERVTAELETQDSEAAALNR